MNTLNIFQIPEFAFPPFETPEYYFSFTKEELKANFNNFKIYAESNKEEILEIFNLSLQDDFQINMLKFNAVLFQMIEAYELNRTFSEQEIKSMVNPKKLFLLSLSKKSIAIIWHAAIAYSFVLMKEFPLIKFKLCLDSKLYNYGKIHIGPDSNYLLPVFLKLRSGSLKLLNRHFEIDNIDWWLHDYNLYTERFRQ